MFVREELIQRLSSLAFEYALIKTEEIPFRDYVVEACARNACGQYGKTWQCPPGVGSLEEVKAKCLAYNNALVFSTCHALEDSFDIEGMREGRFAHERTTDEVVRLFGDTKIRALSAEGCGLCQVCTYPNAPCRFPDRARSSVEANAISVVELAAHCGINYKNGQNTVTYFSVILY